MQAWAEFQCYRCEELHRLAFDIIAYTKFYQHEPCPEGWQPKDGGICIHDYAYRAAKKIKQPKRTVWKGTKKLRSVIYCPTKTTIPQIVKALTEYIIKYYSAKPETIKIEVDFT